MIVKIYREKGKNLTKKSRGQEERTNPYRGIVGGGTHPKRERNGKNRAGTGQDQTPPLFCPS
jgi:hypothetical protein